MWEYYLYHSTRLYSKGWGSWCIYNIRPSSWKAKLFWNKITIHLNLRYIDWTQMNHGLQKNSWWMHILVWRHILVGTHGTRSAQYLQHWASKVSPASFFASTPSSFQWPPPQSLHLLPPAVSSNPPAFASIVLHLTIHYHILWENCWRNRLRCRKFIWMPWAVDLKRGSSFMKNSCHKTKCSKKLKRRSWIALTL